MILGIDTSAAACSVALVRDGDLLARLETRMRHGHASALPPMIGALLTEAGCRFADLRCVGVTVGPGSFTGVRVGLAAARGIGLAAGISCIGVSSFDALARAAGPGGRLLVAIDTRRDDVYAQMFDGERLYGSAFVADARALADRCGTVCRVAGDGRSFAARALPPAVEELSIDLPDPAIVALLAAERQGSAEEHRPVPVYLRAPEVSVAEALVAAPAPAR